MSALPGNRPSADEVRSLNRALDEQLRLLFGRIRPEDLLRSPGDGEWSLAENLAHLAEFPGYFARQLHQWIAGQRTVVGRVAEHSADRNDAIARAGDRPLTELLADFEASVDELAEALGGLRDDHLDTPTVNVKYGEEPLRAFLTRYVLGHKEAHIAQLGSALPAVS
ncbi:MAG: DinB family protein [Acidimicrobiia bacterium]